VLLAVALLSFILGFGAAFVSSHTSFPWIHEKLSL